jgi:RNA polymerase sigma factor (TIGR02999 family)
MTTSSPPLGSPETASGDPAVDRLFLQSYRDLRRIAHARLRRNEHITLLDTTSLVHECYLRFLRSGRLDFDSGPAFLAYASRAMRSIIVDFIRRRRAERRGGGVEHEELEDAVVSPQALAAEREIIAVNDALEQLAAADPRLAQVVEMRYFGGLSEVDIAKCLGVTDRTVRRDWEKARLLLRASLSS